MNRFKINHYSTFSNLKASIVERVIRTIKNKIWREFSLRGNYQWLDILETVVKNYNNTKHSVTGFKPADVKKKNEKEIMTKVFSNIKSIDPTTTKFKIGDFVRISKYRNVFEKGYTPNWSNEIFKITKLRQSNPRTYHLSDVTGDDIQGAFYSQELQKVQYSDIHLVEKTLRKRVVRFL